MPYCKNDQDVEDIEVCITKGVLICIGDSASTRDIPRLFKGTLSGYTIGTYNLIRYSGVIWTRPILRNAEQLFIGHEETKELKAVKLSSRL